MSLNTQYWGATNIVSGGTYLNTRAVLSVDEGYSYNHHQNGATTEYIRTGNFEVMTINNGGAFSQRLNIHAGTPLAKLKQADGLFARSFISNQNYLNGFDTSNYTQALANLSSNWAIQSGSWGVTQSRLQISNFDNSDKFIDYTGGIPLKDVRLITKFGFDTFGSLTEFVLRKSDNGQSYMRVFASSSQIFYQSILNNVSVGFDVVNLGASMNVNTFYWMMITAIGNKYEVFHSLDGQSYNRYFSFYDNTNTEGYCGLGTITQSGVTVSSIFDDFELTEIGTQYTTEDVVRSSLALAGINGVTFQNDFETFNGFLQSTGSSWTTGTSNDVRLNNPLIGASWRTYIMSGLSLTDFVAQVEMRGMSVYGGMIVGRTNTFYGNYHSLSLSGVDNEVETYLGTRIAYNHRGDYVNLGASTWYSLKLVRSGNFLGWYVDDLLVNSFYGISFESTGSSYQSVGVFARSDTAGSSIEFRNFRISKLDNLVDTIQHQPGDTVDNLLSRVLPVGFGLIYENNGYNVVEIGSSRGMAGITNGALVNDSQQNLNYPRGMDLEIVRGKNNLTQIQQSRNVRQNFQADYGTLNITKDETLLSAGDALKNATSMISQDNKDLESFTLKHSSKASMQVYDSINFIDPFLGISHNFIVYNFVRQYNAKNGSYNQTTQFTYNKTEL